MSRAFGDIETKYIKYGGTPGVISSLPEVHAHKLDPRDDFILMGCDGLYDVMSNEDVVNTVFTSVKEFLRPSLSL